MDDTNDHTTTLTTTKEKLVECLDRLIPDVRSIHTLLNKGPDEEIGLTDMVTSIDRLVQNRQNVANLELRMCVVASMKAGKSTIINAILGQNILPSRNAAMTVLPTEVVLCVTETHGKTPEPYLSLPSTLIDQLKNLQSGIRNYFNATETTSELIPQRLPSHPHLVKLAKEILIGNVQFYERNEGVEEMNRVLEKVNDVIRLHEYLIPTKALVSTKQLCLQLPRIHAPYIGIGNEALTNQSLGNLVIVDTPGPNEDTATPFLKEIVQRELDKSFVILVVLDFSQFNTEADKLIKLEIAKIREANHKSSDTLFALVNKVDQRGSRDMTKDEVKVLVKRMFSIHEEPSPKYSRIFEVQALRALMAKQFFIELNALPIQDDTNPFNIEALPSGKDFVKEAYGTAYDDEDPPGKDKAIKDAKAMWKKSGFENFLNGAIEKLIEKAAPHLLEEALVRCRRNVHALHENLLIREQLLNADEQKLRAQMEALQDDCTKLIGIMGKQMDELKKEQEALKKLFTNHFQVVEEHSQLLMKSMFEQARSAVFVEPIQQQDEIRPIENTISALAANLTTLMYKRIRDSIVEGINQLELILKNVSPQWSNEDRITFNNEDDAHRFLRTIEANVRAIPEGALISLRNKVDEQCVDFCSRLNNHLQKNTNDILAMTEERFVNGLNIQLLKPPSIDLKYSEENEQCSDIELEKTYSSWWILRLVNISYECDEKEDAYYHISAKSLQARCERLLTGSMKSIEENLQNYVDGELQQTFDLHFEKIQANLKRYQNYVQQSLSDQCRSAEDKVEFRNKLIEQRELMNEYEKNLETISKNFYTLMNANQNVAIND